jgi:8-oxo-dGTP pyrophosphatase MutT (NUDIX family)
VTDLPPPVPAATVVLVRDGDAGLEALMLRRNARGQFGGMWVFPGGRVDPEDAPPGTDLDGIEAARRAACREAVEECALEVDDGELVAFSHWTPPPVQPKRFTTWFFLARPTGHEVTVDGAEIHEHAWLAPAEVLRRRDEGHVDLAPPTFVTLHELSEVPDVDAALAMARDRAPVPRYATRFATVEGGAVTMWHGDAGYESSDPEAPGPRHRLWMLETGWRFDRTP